MLDVSATLTGPDGSDGLDGLSGLNTKKGGNVINSHENRFLKHLSYLMILEVSKPIHIKFDLSLNPTPRTTVGEIIKNLSNY